MRCDHESVPDAIDDLTSWSDARLIVAARDIDQNSAALDALVRRHACALERRCLLLTSDRERARDLAQETWSRLLRTRATIRSEGSFGAFLAAIAVNVWRDRCKVERRARQLSDQRLLSLDASAAADDEKCSIEATIATAELPEERLLLRLDLAHALARLPARLRAVVIARHVAGESAAEIGRRVGRTEQTITAWLREAVRRLQYDLHDWQSAA